MNPFPSLTNPHKSIPTVLQIHSQSLTHPCDFTPKFSWIHSQVKSPQIHSQSLRNPINSISKVSQIHSKVLQIFTNTFANIRWHILPCWVLLAYWPGIISPNIFRGKGINIRTTSWQHFSHSWGFMEDLQRICTTSLEVTIHVILAP